MEGWVDLGYPAMRRPGVELVTSWSQVRRHNHYTTEPPIVVCSFVRSLVAKTIHYYKSNFREIWPGCSVSELNFRCYNVWEVKVKVQGQNQRTENFQVVIARPWFKISSLNFWQSERSNFGMQSEAYFGRLARAPSLWRRKSVLMLTRKKLC